MTVAVTVLAVMAAVTAAVVTAVVTVDQENVGTNPVRELLVELRPLEVPGLGKQ